MIDEEEHAWIDGLQDCAWHDGWNECLNLSDNARKILQNGRDAQRACIELRKQLDEEKDMRDGMVEGMMAAEREALDNNALELERQMTALGKKAEGIKALLAMRPSDKTPAVVYVVRERFGDGVMVFSTIESAKKFVVAKESVTSSDSKAPVAVPVLA